MRNWLLKNELYKLNFAKFTFFMLKILILKLNTKYIYSYFIL